MDPPSLGLALLNCLSGVTDLCLSAASVQSPDLPVTGYTVQSLHNSKPQSLLV